MLMMLLALIEDEAEGQAFTALYQRYYNKLDTVAKHFFQDDPASAEDAVQNAFIKVIQSYKDISQTPSENLLFVLVAIVKNESISLLRKRRPTVPLQDWDAVAAEADAELGYQEVVALFTRLPETYRAVLELKYLVGLSDREIARKLGLSETAVSSRASRGRELLRKLAEKEGFHP